jgi:rod shape-determining protein MreD
VKNLHVVIACFLFFLLQVLLAPRISIGEISPDFALLLVGYFAINRRPVQGAVGGFIIGLVQDLFNPDLLGLNALTKSITGYALSVVGAKADADNVVFLFGLFGVAALAHDFVYLLFYTGLHLGRFVVMWFTISVPSALYTALVGVIVHKVARYFGSKWVRSFGKARS